MSAKTLRLLAAVLGAAIVTWGALELFTPGSDRVSGSLVLPRLTRAEVDTVITAQEGDTVRLAKDSAGRWTVNGHAASGAEIDAFFAALSDSTLPELVAHSASSFARLGVDSAGGRRLRVVSSGNTRLFLVVGKPGPDFGSSYLRLAGHSEVYLWRGRMGELARRGVDDWRDRVIAAVPPDSVTALEIERGGQRVVLRRDGARWRVAGGGDPDTTAVRTLLDRLRDLRAQGFAPDSVARVPRPRAGRRALTARAGDRVLAALSFDSTAAGVWVRTAGSPAIYRLEQWEVDRLTPGRSELRR